MFLHIYIYIIITHTDIYIYTYTMVISCYIYIITIRNWMVTSWLYLGWTSVGSNPHDGPEAPPAKRPRAVNPAMAMLGCPAADLTLANGNKEKLVSHWYSYGNIWHLREEWIFPWIYYTPGIPWHNWGSSQALLLGWEAAGRRLGWDDLCQFHMVENDGGLGKRFCPA